MKLLKKITKILAFTVLCAIVLFAWLFTPVNRIPYQQTEYYSEMTRNFQNVNWQDVMEKGDVLQVGWGKVNITPPTDSIPLAGYGARWGALFKKVHDPVWVRTFVFDNGIEKVALVAMDLLIVPPALIGYLNNEFSGLSVSLSQIYFTATHSHSSFGGWAPGIVGNLFAGEYNQEVINFLANSVQKSIEKAETNKAPASIGYIKQKAGKLVTNRLMEGNPVDPFVRTLKFSRKDGQTAVLTGFTAHATCYGTKFMQLSGDYPGQLVRLLENDPAIDFAAFSAGAMGSHRPNSNQRTTNEELKDYIATTLYQKISDTLQQIPTRFTTKLGKVKIPLPLREPHVRISQDWRVRPWVFYSVYGDYPAYLSALQLGKITLIGTPCDFSGEFMDRLENSGKGPLIVTSFNGGYIGYITPDKYYDLNEYETRVMNWFGPYNGQYFTEFIKKINKKMAINNN